MTFVTLNGIFNHAAPASIHSVPVFKGRLYDCIWSKPSMPRNLDRELEVD